jgi:hypothetical protein
MDPASFFAIWSKAPAASPSVPARSASSSVSLSGSLCGTSVKGKVVSYRVFVDTASADPMFANALQERDGIIFVSVSRLPGGAVLEVLDTVSLDGCTESVSRKDGRVFFNAQSIRRLSPLCDVISERSLAKEHVLLPEEGCRYGPPSLLYSGTEAEPVSFATSPGIYRSVFWDTSEMTWTDRGQKEVRRLAIRFKQYQWDVQEEMGEVQPISLQMFIWDEQCRQLPGNGLSQDLNVWKALMAVHHIPFYAMVRVDSEFAREETTSLSAMAVRWDIGKYLLTSSNVVALLIDSAKALCAKSCAMAGREGDIVNVSATCSVPTGAGWTYYALTSDPKRITTAQHVVAASKEKAVAVVILALWTAPAASARQPQQQAANAGPSSAKRQKVPAKTPSK